MDILEKLRKLKFTVSLDNVVIATLIIIVVTSNIPYYKVNIKTYKRQSKYKDNNNKWNISGFRVQ